MFWEYDPRVARRWNLDTKPTTGVSPYAIFSNTLINFSDPNGDSILPKKTSNYEDVGVPAKRHDLAYTKTIGFFYDVTEEQEIDVYVNVKVNYTDMLAKGGSIYKDNPGLFEEIETHEEGHIEQIMIAARIPIEYQMKIDDKQVKLKGPIDQVLKDVRNQFRESKKRAADVYRGCR
ncbi:hypothetical protein [Chitinophaga filiformis]|uniref:Uncharacterized protein n=1 Tax=Chitinophaga filiformis TaxID=104663 RepID=A0A1G7N966_CHIFI|nr:hypothetical protein [Chitinophaga filiformis]SDF70598.1 hypothetical protein SAMN04488121_102714 [Chitinophaga filiformis]